MTLRSNTELQNNHMLIHVTYLPSSNRLPCLNTLCGNLRQPIFSIDRIIAPEFITAIEVRLIVSISSGYNRNFTAYTAMVHPYLIAVFIMYKQSDNTKCLNLLIQHLTIATAVRNTVSIISQTIIINSDIELISRIFKCCGTPSSFSVAAQLIAY